ncbi:hypothetical protein [Ruegeria arenilitoris]|uniref:hypothetical protein n=1 Tax=Ruegeria arenilitoris TaxID=1173585 RepID=UPI00147E0741|nr:hypothetical protein [Ruegeria arenilitoris]
MTYQKSLAEIEPAIEHLGRCSSKWWRAAQAITGKKMTELLDEMGDRWNPDSDDDSDSDGIDLDQIIRDAMQPSSHP